MKIKLSFGQRLKALFCGVLTVDHSIPETTQDEQQSATPSKVEKTEITSDQGAQQTLILLQKHGRLIDFIHENIDNYSDEEVGAGARVVHQGCQKVFKDYIKLSPLSEQDEDSAIIIEENFNAQEIKLTGNISGSAPFKGVLIHRGWKLESLNLPKTSHDSTDQIIAPAEVEL